MDGVVVDNHKFHFQAWIAFSQKYKFPLDAQIYRDSYNGKTNADLIRMIFGEITEEQILKYGAEKENLYQSLYKNEMKPHKGIVEYFKFLKTKNVKLALGTSAPTMNVNFTLDTLMIRSYFDVIVDASMVTFGKPHPEVYQLCAKKLHLEPKDCVVFEDSIAGLQSGKNAGCSILGVATSHTADELKSHVNQIIYDFEDPLVFSL